MLVLLNQAVRLRQCNVRKWSFIDDNCCFKVEAIPNGEVHIPNFGRRRAFADWARHQQAGEPIVSRSTLSSPPRYGDKLDSNTGLFQFLKLFNI